MYEAKTERGGFCVEIISEGVLPNIILICLWSHFCHLAQAKVSGFHMGVRKALPTRFLSFSLVHFLQPLTLHQLVVVLVIASHHDQNHSISQESPSLMKQTRQLLNYKVRLCLQCQVTISSISAKGALE